MARSLEERQPRLIVERFNRSELSDAPPPWRVGASASRDERVCWCSTSALSAGVLAQMKSSVSVLTLPDAFKLLYISRGLCTDSMDKHIRRLSWHALSNANMIASAVRLSAALGRQPALAVGTTTKTAGLRTSAASAVMASTTLRRQDGRLCSKNRMQVILDASAPAPAAKEPNWANVSARIRDAKDLAGC
ncbi:uncharacterized protein PAN0_002d1081 [Moesziomyces antarcticus]|uniref:uncharacterized protein n=1 Tax=Pseudozyma antarctica TaxID=84753 RepID=UPI0007198008|nr:uncharacterized protein PAN0_002d1081 [Moesziomyces antarcticus]GAK62879.1 conserved hypothetical protein [Moesziomyces antarcticus]